MCNIFVCVPAEVPTHAATIRRETTQGEFQGGGGGTYRKHTPEQKNNIDTHTHTHASETSVFVFQELSAPARPGPPPLLP